MRLRLREAMTRVVFISARLEIGAMNLRIPVHSTVLCTVMLDNIT
jgi:hypothetical protein